MSGSLCGSCTLCCKLVGVEELEKPMNVWCVHCNKTSGCKIYDTRPQSCHDYKCLWLRSQETDAPMPVETRPNRTHVVLDPTADGSGIVARVDPNYPDAWRHGLLGKSLATIIEKGNTVIVVTGDKRKLFTKRKEQEVLAVNVSKHITEIVFDDKERPPEQTT